MRITLQVTTANGRGGSSWQVMRNRDLVLVWALKTVDSLFRPSENQPGSVASTGRCRPGSRFTVFGLLTQQLPHRMRLCNLLASVMSSLFSASRTCRSQQPSGLGRSGALDLQLPAFPPVVLADSVCRRPLPLCVLVCSPESTRVTVCLSPQLLLFFRTF